MGAVTPSGKLLARTWRATSSRLPRAGIELGSGAGAVTEALVERGIEPSRLAGRVNPSFCRLLRRRYPAADCRSKATPIVSTADCSAVLLK